MSIELRGLLAAVIAGLVVVGATLGLSSVVKSSLPHAKPSKPAAKTASAGAPELSGAALQSAILMGSKFYAASCSSCHGADGVGGYGPNLHNEDMSDPQIASTIDNGVKGKMPAFGGKYKDADVQTMIAYIRSLK